jgi:hypothetical protein
MERSDFKSVLRAAVNLMRWTDGKGQIEGVSKKEVSG